MKTLLLSTTLLLSLLSPLHSKAEESSQTHSFLKEHQAQMETYLVSGVNAKTGTLLLGTVIATPSNALYGDLSDGEKQFPIRGIWAGKGLIQATPLSPKTTEVFLLNVID